MDRKSSICTAMALLTAGLTACGGGGGSDDFVTPTPTPTGDTIALTASGRIVTFDRATPATIVSSRTVTGLGSDELVGMDVRPADGLLYGVSRSGGLYTIDPATGAATSLGALVAAAGDTTDPYTGLVGTRFGVDWNPVADALRIVSDGGQNLRMLPTARMAGGQQQVDRATFTDSALNVVADTPATGVAAAAYTNSISGASTTALYVLDADDDSVYLQSPPNDGDLGGAQALGVDFDAVNGFDIDASDNLGYAALTVGGQTALYSLPVGTASTSPATLIGSVGTGSDPIIGLALKP